MEGRLQAPKGMCLDFPGEHLCQKPSLREPRRLAFEQSLPFGLQSRNIGAFKFFDFFEGAPPNLRFWHHIAGSMNFVPAHHATR
jgi:hypothetical protein